MVRWPKRIAFGGWIGCGLLCQAPAQDDRTHDVGLRGTARFASIQKAVDAAKPGAVVRIGPGFYDEVVVIRKPVTLLGAGWRKTVVTSAKRCLFRVEKADGVVVRDMKLASRAPALKGAFASEGVVTVRDGGGLRIEGSVVCGGPGAGVLIVKGASAEVRKCLISRVGGVGVAAYQGRDGRVHVVDTDLVDCTYCGVRIGKDSNTTTIERCRISGAKWHGLRYDHCAPQINGNVFFGNERTAIYGSGKTRATVVLNLFLGQALTCWFENRDMITSNTFVGRDAGVRVLGTSNPTIRRNVFYRNSCAIRASGINRAERKHELSDGSVTATDNVFFRVDKALAPRDATELFSAELKNTIEDPRFVDAARQNYGLAADSPARRRSIGVPRHIPVRGTWPRRAADVVELPK